MTGISVGVGGKGVGVGVGVGVGMEVIVGSGVGVAVGVAGVNNVRPPFSATHPAPMISPMTISPVIATLLMRCFGGACGRGAGAWGASPAVIGGGLATRAGGGLRLNRFAISA